MTKMTHDAETSPLDDGVKQYIFNQRKIKINIQSLNCRIYLGVHEASFGSNFFSQSNLKPTLRDASCSRLPTQTSFDSGEPPRIHNLSWNILAP
jgi:hypothetical protein